MSRNPRSRCVRPRNLLLLIAGLGGLLHVTCPTYAQNWIPTTAPTTNWTAVGSSADGSKLVAVVYNGPIYTSADSGATWTQTSAPLASWNCVASSADGTKLAAGSRRGPIYTSVNSGATWIENDVPPFYWSSIASSADGNRLVATTRGIPRSSAIYTLDARNNPAWTWVETSAPYTLWNSVASSADGRRLIANTGRWTEVGPETNITHESSVWISTDSGETWNAANVPLGSWGDVASSGDGGRLVVVGETVYTSADYGVTWMNVITPVEFWNKVVSSADGTRLAAIVIDDPIQRICRIFVSTNPGFNWMDAGAPATKWASIASSADGTQLVAAEGESLFAGRIYIRRPTAVPPILSITISDGNALISWPTSATGFGLQENLDLTSTNWADLTTTPTTTNQQNQVSVSTSSGAVFYRLKHP